MLEKWKNRWTVRKFDTKFIPDKNQIAQLADVIQYIPSQLGAVDHVWCLLNPDDQELKDWLVHNIYYTDDDYKQHREYFSALRDAPYMFFSFQLKVPMYFFDMLTPEQENTIKIPKTNEVVRNNAFHAGILVCETLQMGLNACQIACTDGWHANQNTLDEKIANKIWYRYGDSLEQISVTFNDTVINFEKEMIGRPLISVGIGKGIPNTTHSFSPYKDGVTFTGQKAKKWFNNVVM